PAPAVLHAEDDVEQARLVWRRTPDNGPGRRIDGHAFGPDDEVEGQRIALWIERRGVVSVDLADDALERRGARKRRRTVRGGSGDVDGDELDGASAASVADNHLDEVPAVVA